MKQRYLLFCLFILFYNLLLAQHGRTHTCAPILWEVERLIAEGASVEAQKALNLLNICDRKSELVVARNHLQNRINALNEKRTQNAVIAEGKAVRSKNAEIDARLATVREQTISDSIKVRNYNMRQALSTAQEDPSLAWNMVHHLRGPGGNYHELAEVVYSVANDPKNETYIKSLQMEQPVLTIGWNAAGELLIADAAGTLHRYAKDGRPIQTQVFTKPLAHQQMIAQFNRQGTFLFFTRGEQDDTLVIHDVEAHTDAVQLGAPDRIFKFAASPNLQYIALGLHRQLYCYDFSADTVALRTIPFEGWPAIMSVDNKGIIAAAATDQPLHFYDLHNQGAPAVCKNSNLSEKYVRSAAFTEWPDVLLMGGTGFEASLCKWNDPLYYAMNGHTNNVTSSDVNYEKDMIATGSSDKTVRLWTLKEGVMVETAVLKGHTDGITDIAFSLDGGYLATVDYSEHLKIWRIEGRQLSNFKSGGAGYITAIQFSPDSKRIAAGNSDGHIKIVNMETKAEQLVQTPLKDSVLCLVFTSNRQFVTGSSRGILCLWEVGDSLPRKIVRTSGAAVHAVSAAKNGRQLVAACEDGTVRIFNERLDSVFAFKAGGGYPLRGAAFLGEELVVADSRGHIRFYNKYYTEKQALALKASAIHVAAISASGHYLLTANNHDMRLWDLRNPRRSFDLEDAHTNRVSGLAFSPDERFLFSVSWDGSALVWTRSGKKMYKVRTNVSAICVAAAADGRSFATGSATIDVWRTPDSYIDDCVALASPEELAASGILIQQMSFYRQTEQIPLILKAARQFADIGSFRTADTLYAIALAKADARLKNLRPAAGRPNFAFSEEEEEWQSVKTDIETDRAEMYLEMSRAHQNAAQKEAWQPLLQSAKTLWELETYAYYFLSQKNWKAVKISAERARALKGEHTLWSRKLLYYAQVMLYNKPPAARDLLFTRELSDLESLTLFYAEEADNLPDSLMLQKATLSQMICHLMKRYDELHPNDTITVQYLTDRYVNAGWYQLLSGDAANALKNIDAGIALCKKIPYPVSDALLQMNRAHALLLLGQKAAALPIYARLAPLPFIDTRFATFGEAFADDFRLLREANTYPGINGKVLSAQQEADIKKVEDFLNVNH